MLPDQLLSPEVNFPFPPLIGVPNGVVKRVFNQYPEFTSLFSSSTVPKLLATSEALPFVIRSSVSSSVMFDMKRLPPSTSMLVRLRHSTSHSLRLALSPTASHAPPSANSSVELRRTTVTPSWIVRFPETVTVVSESVTSSTSTSLHSSPAPRPERRRTSRQEDSPASSKCRPDTIPAFSGPYLMLLLQGT